MPNAYMKIFDANKDQLSDPRQDPAWAGPEDADGVAMMNAGPAALRRGSGSLVL